MDIRTFLEIVSKTGSLPKRPVICLLSKEYPLLFCAQVITYLKKQGSMIERCNAEGDIAHITATLSMQNFNSSVIYWLDNFHSLVPKKQQELVEYCATYNGPHQLFFVCNPDVCQGLSSNHTTYCVALENSVPQDIVLLRFLINNAESCKTDFITNIATTTHQFSWDNAVLLAHYERVLGKNMAAFFSDWFDHIVEQPRSLFLLSQYFFNKKPTQFFQQWSYCAHTYQVPFWITFWSDQVWRAYAYCSLMKQKQVALAKKVQHKLPFSFINRDWSAYTVLELKSAHLFLYDADFRLKNGASEIAFEHFFMLFFNNSFRKT